MEGCTRRSLDEEATLRENPPSYRLSCITSVYEDITVEVQGPVGKFTFNLYVCLNLSLNRCHLFHICILDFFRGCSVDTVDCVLVILDLV